MKATIKAVLYVAAVFTAALVSNAPLAKNYRNKLTRFVVRFAAGGPSDVIARVMAQDTVGIARSFHFHREQDGDALASLSTS